MLGTLSDDLKQHILSFLTHSQRVITSSFNKIFMALAQSNEYYRARLITVYKINNNLLTEFETFCANTGIQSDFYKLYKNIVTPQKVFSDGDNYSFIINLTQLVLLSGNKDLVSAYFPTGFISNKSIDIHGNTPLHYIAMVSDVDYVKNYLNEIQNNFNIKTDFAQSLLHAASLSGSRPVIRFFLDNFPELKDTLDFIGANYLHYLCINGNVDTIKTILEIDEQLNTTDKEGYTLVDYASKANTNKAVDYLINNNICQPKPLQPGKDEPCCIM